MKAEQRLKVAFIILLIVLICLISFGGIYIQNTKFVEDIIPEYSLGMDLEGSRVISLVVSDAVNEVIKENYEKSKEIFEKRLQQMKLYDENLTEMEVEDYTIRFDEETGKTILQLPENEFTDMIAQYTAIKGTFEVVDEEGNVLLNNTHLKNAQVGYQTAETGTTVYLTIQFNEEGTKILKDISNTFIKTTDEEGEETTKTVELKLDDTTILSTYFEEEIANGILNLSIGQASSNTNDFSTYLQEASNLALLLNTGALPVSYTMEENRYVMSDITRQMFQIPAIVVISLIVVGMIVFIIKYRKNGLLVAISLPGYIAIFLLVLRYTNVMLTMEGIVGILIAIILNYIFCTYLLHLLKKNEAKTQLEASIQFKEAILKAVWIIIPVSITAIVLCFSGWLPIFSFGMVMFWGIVLMILYNLIITRTLIISCTKK